MTEKELLQEVRLAFDRLGSWVLLFDDKKPLKEQKEALEGYAIGLNEYKDVLKEFFDLVGVRFDD